MTPPRYQTDLTDDQWALLVPFMPAPAKTGRPRADLRAVTNGILYLVRSGCQWRLLPRCFPPWSTVHTWYRRWRTDGTLQAVHDALWRRCRVQAGRDESPASSAVDSQSVKAAGQGGEKGYDAGKKVAGRKRHLWVDSLGLLVAVLVTGAGTHDARAACDLLHRRRWDEELPRLRVVYADSMYRAECLHEEVFSFAPFELHVVTRPEGSEGFVKLPQRWVVERTIAWLGRSRRLSKDVERLPESSEAMVRLSMTHLMLRRLAPTRRKRSERFRYKKAK
jgi:putative transposase